ncbi:MAG: PAS domain-containing protein [Gammaproteobacteria bacterium]|nr:PAS domain-containing protein [Gammaproteobacteria bacterium]
MSESSPNDRAAPLQRPPAARIVAIGASAGGLEPLELFFQKLPARSGAAYLVVQHLDPTQKALLVALLQRVTSLPVTEAEDGMAIVADHVYVIPPNAEMRVSDDRLQVSAPREPRGLRLPVDVLFSSLARERRESAVAVVLSGMGVDGTQGLQSIKSLGGLCAVQTPATAQFDSMPASAIAAGYADIVAPPAELPGRILAIIGAPREPAPAATDAVVAARAAPMEHVLHLLRTATRHDFSLYKRSTVQRRIERRMAIHQLRSVAEYAQFLERNPGELELLFKELLIGVTQFFRDPTVWQHFEAQVLPELLATHPAESPLRAWVVGCSTGEEAYSLAIGFADVVSRIPQFERQGLQIFATDLNADAIAVARRGEYPASIAKAVPADRLARYFTCHDDRFRIASSVRDMVLFAEQDVVLDPPFTRLDILCCRNLMIYLDPRLQQKLLPLFHYSLRAGGVLMLGSSETIGQYNRLFEPLESKLRLYRRTAGGSGGAPELLYTAFPSLSPTKRVSSVPSEPDTSRMPDSLQAAAERVLLQAYAPPAVMVNGDGEIVYISGRSGRYLEPAAGKANWNFHAMIRDGLRAPLATALAQARLQDGPVYCPGLTTKVDGRLRSVDVTVERLHEPVVLRDMYIVVFREAPTYRKSRRRAPSAAEAAHLAELEACREEIRRLRDENRSSREELQSTNEELQSINEELQSANEELTTSKEEMQSMNEELQTVNAEMQTRLDDLALAQGDMTNLLNSTEIAILFLDHDLNVRRYTERASKIVNLREADIGRPLSDLTSSLQYPDLMVDAQNTMRTLVFSEKQIRSSDGRWFSVRIMPYRRLDNVIDGAVITLVDITSTKELEAHLRQHQ